MFILIAYFVISLLLVFFFANSSKLMRLFQDKVAGQHKVHTHQVTRSGGLIFLFSLLTYFFTPETNIKIIFYLFIFLTIGLFEDFLKDIRPLIRFGAIVIFSFICIYDMGFLVSALEVDFVDKIFSNSLVLQIIFTSIALSIAINSFNLIDGFNGLMLGVSLIAISMLLFVVSKESIILSDQYLFLFFIYLSIISLFLFNFPFGRIFTGDGGAYAIGYSIGIYSIIIFNDIDISPWFFAVILCYPMTELFISFSRRILLMKKNAFTADLNHLHSLIYLNLQKRENNFIVKHSNPITSVIIWVFYLIQILPLLFFKDDSFLLKINFLFCTIFYLLFYFFVSKTKKL